MNASSPSQPGESIHYVPLKNLAAIYLFHFEDESTIFALGTPLPEKHIDHVPGVATIKFNPLLVLRSEHLKHELAEEWRLDGRK